MAIESIKNIFAVFNRDGNKGYWTEIGRGVVRSDGTIDLEFDYIPSSTDISIQLRDPGKKEDRPAPAANAPPLPRKQILGIARRPGPQEELRITKIGIAFPNKDGSFTLRFNYFPTSPGTKLQVRDFDER